MPKTLQVFLAAMTPYLNLKLAIPLGMSLHLPLYKILFFAVAGDLVPALFILYLLGPVSAFLRRVSKPIDTFMEKLFTKTREKHFEKFQKYGAWGIFLFIATPLPGSGNITGGIMAFILGIKFWKTALIVTAGTFVSALLITAGFESLVGIWRYFF
ncbi:MAG: small multi-drug export protein [Candidatus Peregrinibacteria bacterium]|nr:small multi-drug export protein [Candidatus Peregrinibacteria bacterium]